MNLILSYNLICLIVSTISNFANASANLPIFHVLEESPKGTLVGNIWENEQIREWIGNLLGVKHENISKYCSNCLFTITSNYFTIDSSYGIISTTKLLDREAILQKKYISDAKDKVSCEPKELKIEDNNRIGRNMKSITMNVTECFVESSLNIFNPTNQIRNGIISEVIRIQIYVNGIFLFFADHHLLEIQFFCKVCLNINYNKISRMLNRHK